MVRKTGVLILALGVGYMTLVTLQGIGAVSRGPAAQAADTITLGQFILRDTFNDNLTGPMWRVLADDPNLCTMKEVNQRLELQATNQVSVVSAGYVSSGWRLDPRCDFSVKVDYHYDLMSFAVGWVSLGVTPEVGDPWEQNAVIGVGCAHGYANYWFRKQAGFSVDSDSAQRSGTNGTLYISYNAGTDELYLGLADYGPDDAWSVLPGLRNVKWGNRPVYIWLAGGCEGLNVPSGRVYLDNLLVQTGTVIEASLKEVHRFWSPVLERHFYTISEAEKEKLVLQFNDTWRYEGVAYHAFSTDADLDTTPVYRFWSDKLSGHFYTTSAKEKDWLIAEYPHVWTLEGVAFYVYPEGRQPVGTVPVYRFWSPTKSAHFYTTSEAERDGLQANYSNVWTYEGIAWYAYE